MSSKSPLPPPSGLPMPPPRPRVHDERPSASKVSVAAAVRRRRLAAVLAVAGVIGVGAVWLTRDSDSDRDRQRDAEPTTIVAQQGPLPSSPSFTAPVSSVVPIQTPTTSAEVSANAPASEPSSPSTAPASTTASTAAPSSAPYVTQANGLPEPVRLEVGIDGAITLSGAVPTQAAADLLVGFASESGTTPVNDADLVVNPAVPADVPVQITSLNSPRFDEGSSEMTIELAAQYNRLLPVMTALPDVTMLIIGHADQRGDPQTNIELSAARATSVFNYFVSNGIDPGRMSTRGAGATDLLTPADDPLSLALNRRTEFVLTGIFVER
jgi:outer membrane protein OmpA-like peptidoglycan-associated protein